nr:hypothetical protein Iba_chr07aCG16100 [Ipomoea batatas]
MQSINYDLYSMNSEQNQLNSTSETKHKVRDTLKSKDSSQPSRQSLLPPKENIQTRARSQQAICHYIHPFSTSVSPDLNPSTANLVEVDTMMPFPLNAISQISCDFVYDSRHRWLPSSILTMAQHIGSFSSLPHTSSHIPYRPHPQKSSCYPPSAACLTHSVTFILPLRHSKLNSILSLQMNNPQPNSEPQHLCFYLSKPHVHIRQSSAQTCNRNQQSCFMPIKMVIHQPNSEQEASCSFAQDEQSSAHHQPGAELSLMSNCSSEHSSANPPPCRL